MQQLITKYSEILKLNEHRLNSYGTINGYLSPSRLLKEISNDDGIEAWRKRVGEEEADRILAESANRGTIMHKCIEDYFSGIAIENSDIAGYSHFARIKPLLANIEPLIVEATLFSDKLEISGRCDTIGYYNNVLSIIDYKTSRKPKRIEWMKSYCVQVSLYAVMAWDMLGIKITQGVLLNSPDDLNVSPQEFIIPISEYIQLALELYMRYKNGERKTVKL